MIALGSLFGPVLSRVCGLVVGILLHDLGLPRGRLVLLALLLALPADTLDLMLGSDEVVAGKDHDVHPEPFFQRTDGIALVVQDV